METAANAVATDTAAQQPDTEVTQETTTSAPVEEPAKQAETGSEPEWFKKRFDEITGRFRSEERRAAAAEQRAQQLEQQLRQQQAPPAKEEPAKKLEDFGYDEGKYQEYLFDRAEKRAVEAAKRARSEEQEQVRRQSNVRKFQEREVEFEKVNKDYRDVAYYAPIGDSVAEIIREMDSGPEVAYYLGKNKSIALALNDLPPHIAAIELGRIDAKLSSEKAARAAALEKARQQKAVSNAPDPAATIEASGEPSTVKPDEADSDKLSDAEWARRRNKQLARKGNR